MERWPSGDNAGHRAGCLPGARGHVASSVADVALQLTREEVGTGFTSEAVGDALSAMYVWLIHLPAMP